MVKQATLSLAGMTLLKSGFASVNKNQDMPVINSGIGGNNTVDLLSRIDKDCIAHHPALTVLMVGTNDMNSMKYVPLDQYQVNLTEIIVKIKHSGSQLLLMTILPMYEPYLLTRHPAAFYQPEGIEGRRQQVNNVIKEAARKHTIHLLDIGHRFDRIGKIGIDKDSLLQNEANSNKTDGVHPTSTGYRFIALSVYDYIMDHSLPTENIVCFGDSITKGGGNNETYPAYLESLLKNKTPHS
jgi:lysophospholipase L1-like esterase